MLQNGKFNKAEAQRRLKVLGAQFEVEWFNEQTGEWYNKQYRTIAHVQGNAFAGVKALVDKDHSAYQMVNQNPHGNGSWLWFDDKNTKYFCHDDGMVTLISTYEDRNQPIMRYKPVEEETAEAMLKRIGDKITDGTATVNEAKWFNFMTDCHADDGYYKQFEGNE